jgi:hypothetical protein
LSAFYRTRKYEWNQLCFHLEKFGKNEIGDSKLVDRMIKEAKRLPRQWHQPKDETTDDSTPEVTSDEATPDSTPEATPTVAITPPPRNYKYLFKQRQQAVSITPPPSRRNSYKQYKPQSISYKENMKQTQSRKKTILIETPDQNPENEKNKISKKRSENKKKKNRKVYIESDSSEAETPLWAPVRNNRYRSKQNADKYGYPIEKASISGLQYKGKENYSREGNELSNPDDSDKPEMKSKMKKKNRKKIKKRVYSQLPSNSPTASE